MNRHPFGVPILIKKTKNIYCNIFQKSCLGGMAKKNPNHRPGG